MYADGIASQTQVGRCVVFSVFVEFPFELPAEIGFLLDRILGVRENL